MHFGQSWIQRFWSLTQRGTKDQDILTSAASFVFMSCVNFSTLWSCKMKSVKYPLSISLVYEIREYNEKCQNVTSNFPRAQYTNDLIKHKERKAATGNSEIVATAFNWDRLQLETYHFFNLFYRYLNHNYHNQDFLFNIAVAIFA